jgi:signal transduction histidine kinase
MSLTANYPIFNPQQKLQGVLSIDLTLTQFSEFLQSLPRDYQSKIFITEADGTLVASSQTQPIYQTQPIARRLRLDMLDDPIVQAIGKHYRQRGLFQATLQRNHRQKIRLNRETYYLDISPWEDPLGLHWLVFVITPEKTFMGDVHQSLRLSLLLGGLITLGAISLSIFMTRQLTRPIRRLSEASEVIASGDLSQVIAANWGSWELNDLAHAFEAMRLSLQNAQQSLANYAKSLENRIHDRTAALEASNQHLSAALRELKSTQNQLVQSEKLAALGQLITSVAHEFNTPLGAIQSSIRNIVHCLETDLEILPSVMNDLPREYNELFLALLQRSMDNMPAQAYRASQEKRQLRRSIVPVLTEANIQNPDWVADSLIEMDVHESLPEFITLLQACPNPQILNLIYNLASAQKSAKTITHAASDAAEYVTALKTYTHNGENVTLTPVNLVDSLETAIMVHQSQLQHRIVIERHYNRDAVMILGVNRELQQIWSNLINNSIQAIEDHGLIQLSILTQATSIAVQIADNGCGIPAAIQPKLFEPFFTTKSAGEGTGLGLSIVKRLVDNHHGQIAIKSEPGQTIVTVTLPTIPLPIAVTKDSPPS